MRNYATSVRAHPPGAVIVRIEDLGRKIACPRGPSDLKPGDVGRIDLSRRRIPGPLRCPAVDWPFKIIRELLRRAGLVASRKQGTTEWQDRPGGSARDHNWVLLNRFGSWETASADSDGLGL